MPTVPRTPALGAIALAIGLLMAVQTTMAAPTGDQAASEQKASTRPAPAPLSPESTLQAEPADKPAAPGDDARRRRGGRRRGQAPPSFRNDGAPKVGEDAKLFKLKRLNEEREVDLNDFSGKKPVILFFGSYT